jgi:hypothetical protein
MWDVDHCMPNPAVAIFHALKENNVASRMRWQVGGEQHDMDLRVDAVQRPRASARHRCCAAAAAAAAAACGVLPSSHEMMQNLPLLPYRNAWTQRQRRATTNSTPKWHLLQAGSLAPPLWPAPWWHIGMHARVELVAGGVPAAGAMLYCSWHASCHELMMHQQPGDDGLGADDGAPGADDRTAHRCAPLGNAAMLAPCNMLQCCAVMCCAVLCCTVLYCARILLCRPSLRASQPFCCARGKRGMPGMRGMRGMLPPPPHAFAAGVPRAEHARHHQGFAP